MKIAPPLSSLVMRNVINSPGPQYAVPVPAGTCFAWFDWASPRLHWLVASFPYLIVRTYSNAIYDVNRLGKIHRSTRHI